MAAKEAQKKTSSGRPTERHICVLYYLDEKRYTGISNTTRWYKYARTAKDRAHDNLVTDVYGAMLAIVYDDYTGKDLYIMVRVVDDNGQARVETRWAKEAMRQDNLGTSRDPFGSFLKKTSKLYQAKAKRAKKEQ